jgi:hypothetical protein
VHRVKEGGCQYKIEKIRIGKFNKISFYLSLGQFKNMIIIVIKLSFSHIVKNKISVYCMVFTGVIVREWGRLKVVKRDFLKLSSPPFIKYILDIDI